MYKLLKPILFKMDAEKAHHLIVNAMNFAYNSVIFRPVLGMMRTSLLPSDSVEIAGLKFPSRIGLAAGFDKNAIAYKPLSYLGFGFIEIGTVTPLAQPGNEMPRLFRLPKDQALINRMGFNNEGSKAAAERLRSKPASIIVGGNIGKNKITANEDAVSDYIKAFNDLYEVVDYLVVNVSSPNTPGLRDLQNVEAMRALLEALVVERTSKKSSKPIFLKLAPDLAEADLLELTDLAISVGIEGLIISNTTLSRADLTTSKSEVDAIGAGGLSGAPLTHRSTELVRIARQRAGKSLAIIASGGVMSGTDVKSKLEAGADLVQLYSGFIYKGPELIKEATLACRK